MRENKDNPKLVYAFGMMLFSKSSGQERHQCTEKDYAEGKKLLSKLRKGIPLTEEHKLKCSKALTGHPGSDFLKQRVRETWTGRKHSDKTKLKMSVSHSGYVMLLALKDKLSAVLTGTTKSDDTKLKMSAAQTGRICVNDGTKHFRIREDQLQEYLDKGFVLGSISTKQGLIFINNGKECIQIYPNELEIYESQGYHKGILRKPMEKKQWYNNGDVETLSSSCPEGFIAGRLKRK